MSSANTTKYGKCAHAEDAATCPICSPRPFLAPPMPLTFIQPIMRKLEIGGFVMREYGTSERGG